jgi:hypothetical protein
MCQVGPPGPVHQTPQVKPPEPQPGEGEPHRAVPEDVLELTLENPEISLRTLVLPQAGHGVSPASAPIRWSFWKRFPQAWQEYS